MTAEYQASFRQQIGPDYISDCTDLRGPDAFGGLGGFGATVAAISIHGDGYATVTFGGNPVTMTLANVGGGWQISNLE